MPSTPPLSRRVVTAAAAAVLAAIALTGCSSTEEGQAEPSSAAPTTTAPPVVETVTQDRTTINTETETDTETETETATETDETTSPDDGPTPSGGDDHGGDTPNPCPDPATLGAVTPDYNPDFPINSVNCSEGWAVGFYEADGKNQTTGIWKQTGSAWQFQDRAAVCAEADNLPDSLYKQACSGS